MMNERVKSQPEGRGQRRQLQSRRRSQRTILSDARRQSVAYLHNPEFSNLQFELPRPLYRNAHRWDLHRSADLTPLRDPLYDRVLDLLLQHPFPVRSLDPQRSDSDGKRGQDG